MNTIARTCRWGALIVLATVVGGCASARVAGVAEEAFPVEQYARQRSETNRRLSEVRADLAPRLRAGSQEERARAAKEIAGFVREHLGPYPEQVDQLYTFADRQAGARYTETMRYQHGEIGSRIRFLEELASAPEPDVEMFGTHLNALLHYMWVHLDTEMYTIGVLVVDNELDRRRRVASTGGSK